MMRVKLLRVLYSGDGGVAFCGVSILTFNDDGQIADSAVFRSWWGEGE
jgi:hypothetical protein